MARLALLWAAVMPTVGGHATGQTPLAKGQPRARPRRLEGYSARRLADEDDWTDGPAGFCDGDEAELGETASREECIDACDDAGYEAMTWDTISTACYCFIEEWCDCVEEYDAENADDWCWCGEKDGFEPEEMSESECAAAGCEYESGSEDGGWTECNCDEAMCASAGGEWQCEAYGPMAFKGFPPPEVCGAYSYSYSYDPFMPCPDEDSAYLTCLNAAAQNGVDASAGLGWGCCDQDAVAGGSFPSTCAGMQTYSEFQDACGDPAPECAAEWSTYIECVYAEVLDVMNEDLTGAAPLNCDLSCTAALGSDAATARGPFFAATAALLGAATALAR